ncbi:metalloregulator ArsR/SmtB family transcription factor [Alicyclobacillus fastidiosus]|uniref:Metalloregulator ArsR/SmtB family transcription factor n=1 Tax=Alicyclobacillus fastidiosus TaxID=392011 RepID=A0ABY6ZI02_9BACL|nr:metalloregulator ArsR/SmtB family transcription factor [Alicyclobacillus fastidiosus]WAH42538.1 metalloregulator ArsR/SmtB family transcription factor [Alicyclobacillus fastidiosus]GMA64384.1 transcriptional regulator [Alicyclobacillus fastidiosus]
MLDTYTVVAEPSRRRILDRLLQSDSSVTELANALGLSQPLVSKHLRALRESGLVQVQVDAQRRVYSLDAGPLAEIDEWLSAYRAKWNQHVDALEAHLDERKNAREGNTK